MEKKERGPLERIPQPNRPTFSSKTAKMDSGLGREPERLPCKEKPTWEMVKGHMEDICPHAPEDRGASTSVENGSEWFTQMNTSMHPAKNVGFVHERSSAVSTI